MADNGEGDSAEERLAQEHRKERKELQAKIQGMKHAVPKGDKKKKKEVTAEIAKLEAELEQKHEQEIKELKESAVSDTTESDIVSEVNNLTIAATDKVPQKKSKAQKRKEKKAAKEKEKEQRIAEEEANNIYSARNIEARKLKEILLQRGLGIKEISSDGHCLYNAVQDQLERHGVQTSLESLRKQTSEYMLKHADEFLPFLIDSNTGDLLTHDQYVKYCSDIANTAAWAGHHEIKALSQIFEHCIEIIQADGPLLTIGEDFSETNPQIILSYHRHAYGLGEHYNSVIPRELTENSDEES
ncbi:deubiquitinase OTUD6B-like [Ptychodera flava]|uniref:deubiquitinase OTUD6B-like n=1 Tax=Ptychodera flava TaxID=63121 RepID=UPI003969EB9B